MYEVYDIWISYTHLYPPPKHPLHTLLEKSGRHPLCIIQPSLPSPHSEGMFV